MAYIIRQRLFLSVATCCLVTMGLATPATALSQSELKAISGNCSAIKQSLNQLQKVDSRTRTYLGTTYETIANKFITPLNLRLVKNNRSTLSNIQSDFSAEQANFRNHYTDYMREMEILTAIDCQAEPEKFYEQLRSVRDRRKDVKLSTEKLNKLINNQYQAALKLRQELE